ncbi:hypothetical protein [Achromobacter xylosoxidans]|nr:hypothetical protein [Achromobacter xylosoxidans]
MKTPLLQRLPALVFPAVNPGDHCCDRKVSMGATHIGSNAKGDILIPI